MEPQVDIEPWPDGATESNGRGGRLPGAISVVMLRSSVIMRHSSKLSLSVMLSAFGDPAAVRYQLHCCADFAWSCDATSAIRGLPRLASLPTSLTSVACTLVHCTLFVVVETIEWSDWVHGGRRTGQGG